MKKLEAAKITGNKIRAYRKNKKLKQSELAEMVGTTTASVSRWERGEVQIPLEQAKNVAKALDVDLRDLLDISTSHVLRKLDEDTVSHFADVAISDVNSVIDEYIDRMRNRIISLCSSETIDARTLKFVQKPPEDLLSSHQVDVLQRVLSDARDLRIRSEAAIKYWFEIIDNSLKGSEDYKSDDELRIESYLCQRAEMRAFNNHQEDKKNE